MIIVDRLSKSFCDQIIFDNVCFKVNPKERIGVTGRNGHGKTTLFNLICGTEAPDFGEITKPKNYKIGYVTQNFNFKESTSLLEASLGLPTNDSSFYWKVEKILTGLGFDDSKMKADPKTLSGGYQVRLNLAKILLSETDMLLLDEPNNYLDITSIRWLSRFLSSWKNELMLITHDRSFMDKVVTHTIGIHRKKISKISGPTQKLYEKIAREEKIHEKTRINDEKKKKEIDLFITRFRAKARLAGMVQSRIKTISKMPDLNRLDKIKNLDFSFTLKPFTGKYILSVKDLTFSYDKVLPIIKNLNITIGSKDRICVIGENGKGKTTLLKLLSNNMNADSGEINYHPSTSIGYFEQGNTSLLVENNTVVEEILASNPNIDVGRARDICGTMMFEKNHALKKIKILSGGEKSRVMLGKVLARASNILLLDEPTNHLDIHSCDSLIEALNEFDGAVVIVTHNEMLLKSIAERLIIFQDGKISVAEKTYDEFLEGGGWMDEEFEKKPFDPEKKKSSFKEQRKKRADFLFEKNRVLKPLEKKVLALEESLIERENYLIDQNQQLIIASQSKDPQSIKKTAQSVHQLKSDINKLFTELLNATDEYEKKKKELEEIEK